MILRRKLEPNHILSTSAPAPIYWQEKFILAVMVSVILLIEVRTAALRPLWYDELSTLTISSAPTIKGMFHAIPADGNPPLYFLLARLCLSLPIPIEIALRIPSIVATDITALLIFLFVRRNTDKLFAFFAMSVFLGSAFAHYAAEEARSYALLLFFTSVVICCWQSASRGESRRLTLAGIAVGTAGAIFTHHYGIIYVALPLLAGEGVRTWQRHRIDFSVFAAMLTGAASLVFTIPTMLHGQAALLKAVKLCPAFWARPTPGSLLTYVFTVPPPIAKYVLAAGALGAFLRFVVFTENGKPKKLTKLTSRVHAEDLAVGLALVLILPIMVLITRIGTDYFMERYAIGSSLGVAVVFGLLTSHWNERLPKIEGFVPMGIIYGLLMTFLGFSPIKEITGVQADQLLLSAPARDPIVIADAVVFWPTWWYSDPGARTRLHYLSDLSYAVKQPDFIPEYVLSLEQPYGAPKLDNYGEFLASHREFFLYCVGMPRLEWVKDRLSNEGWRLTLIANSGNNVLFRVDRP